MNKTFKEYEALAKAKLRHESKIKGFEDRIEGIDVELDVQEQLSEDIVISIKEQSDGEVYLKLKSLDDFHEILFANFEAIALRDTLNKLFPKKGR